jgi:Leucine-rich repeat (LRR) protein
MASRVLFIMLLAIGAVAQPRAVQQSQSAAAGLDSCGLNDSRLSLNTTCNSTCRTAIHRALVDIYNSLNGSKWDWGSLEDRPEDATATAAAAWPDSSRCVACSLTSGALAPSYCCWEGVVCCGEHHNYADEHGQDACQPYSVTLLQLRSGNVAGKLSSIMQQLQVLHAQGLTYLDLSRNNLTGSIPEAIGSLNKLQVLMLGSNCELRSFSLQPTAFHL